jgi:hypothetical protein
MMVRAMLASLPLLAMQPPAGVPAPISVQEADPNDSARWRCDYSVEGEQGEVNVIRSLDADGRVVYDYVNWLPRRRIGTSAVGWDRRDPPTSTALPWTLRTDIVSAMLTLSRPARRPVWLVLRVDGRVAGRRLLFRQMSDLPDYEREQLELWPEIRTSPPSMGPVPDLAGADEVVISAEEEGGETLASHAISLPDRALVDAAVAEAVPALAAAVADYRARCREERQPPRLQAMPASTPVPAGR